MFMDVGGRIKYFREKKGITVNKLANLSGVSQSYLQDIELGNKQPTVEYLEFICFGLGISLKDFFDFENSEDELSYITEKLNPNQRRLLAEFIKSL